MECNQHPRYSLVSKLPNGLIDRWNRTAYNIRKRQECEPSLSDLIEFMDQETTLVNDPISSREELQWNSEKVRKTQWQKIQKGGIIGNRGKDW